MAETPRRHLGAGAALSVVVQGGPLLAAGLLSIVIARTIGPSGNGRFALLVTLTGTAALVFSLGLSSGITYEVSRRRWQVRRAFVESYLAGVLLGSLGFAAALVVFLALRESVFHGIRVELAVLALASLPPVLAYQFADSILLARERYEGYAGLELSHSAVLLAVGAGLAIPFGLTGAVIGLPAAALAGACVGALLLARESRRDATEDRGGSLRRALGFGLQGWGGSILQQVNYRFDVIILGAFASTQSVGIYSIALTLTGIAWVLPQALQTVLFPRVASLDEAQLLGQLTTDESDEALAKAVRHGVLLTVPTGLAVAALLLVAVPLLYGSAFHQTIALGFVLLPGVLLLGIGKILSSGITGRGHPRLTLYATGISTPVTLALYFGLIPLYHEWGAAAASSISYALSALLALFFFRRVTGIGLRSALVPRTADVADYGGLVRLARLWRPSR
ncbi:MAG: oligosaccharide flippase family protein [Gaiellaceae bacterium]